MLPPLFVIGAWRLALAIVQHIPNGVFVLCPESQLRRPHARAHTIRQTASSVFALQSQSRTTAAHQPAQRAGCRAPSPVVLAGQ